MNRHNCKICEVCHESFIPDARVVTDKEYAKNIPVKMNESAEVKKNG